MSNTARLAMPQLVASQSQKEITHNEALAILDALVQCAAISETNTPAVGPSAGDTYIVGTAPTGVWATHAKDIAYYDGSAWDYHDAKSGFVVYDLNAAAYKAYISGSWTTLLSISGAATFTGLTDCPASYDGYAGYYVRVNENSPPDGLEFVAASPGGGGSGDLTVADTDTIALTYAGSPETLTADLLTTVETLTLSISGSSLVDIAVGTLDVFARLSSITQDIVIMDPTGSPVDGQRLTLRLEADAEYNLTWGGSYRQSDDITLPDTLSGGGKYDYCLFMYNAGSDTWDFLAKNRGF